MKFKKKNFISKMLMKQNHLEEYYRDLRKYEYENNIPHKSKDYYEKWYDLLIKIFKLEMKLDKRTFMVHKDLRNMPNDRPKIYVVTHIGRYDIEVSLITRKEPAVYLWGDPGLLYKSFEKILIDRIGAIFVDTPYRDDCHIGEETMVKYLNDGLNININAEGAWNIEPNQVVLKLYKGAIRSAIKTGCYIVPVALTFDKDNWIISYGNEIDASKMDINNIDEENKKLRDAIATLKWDLLREYSGNKDYVENNSELLYTAKRSELDENAYNEFLNSIMKDTDNGYGIKEINETVYKDKEMREQEQVYDDLEEYIKTYPAFFLSSNERFKNYIEICNNLDNILHDLEIYRNTQTMESNGSKKLELKNNEK